MGKTSIWTTIQLTEVEDTSSLLDAKGDKLIQKMIGKFYYYARTVHYTMLVALGELATKQTLGTSSEKVAEDVVPFL